MQDNADCVKRHNEEFTALPLRQKAVYRAAAIEENRLRDLRNFDLLESKRARLSILEMRKAQGRQASAGIPNTLSAMRFSDQDLEELAVQVCSDGFRGNQQKAKWAELISDPTPPPLAVQSEILRLERSFAAAHPPPPNPWWASRVITHRDRCLGTALAFAEDPGEVYYFLCAKMTTTTVAYLKLSRLERVIPAFNDNAPEGPFDFDPSIYLFDFGQYEYTIALDMPREGDDGRVWVFQDFSFEQRTVMSTRREPILLEDFLLQFPIPPVVRNDGPRDGGGGGGRISPDAMALLLEEFPWLLPEDFPAVGGHGGGRGDGHRGGQGRHGPQVLDAER